MLQDFQPEIPILMIGDNDISLYNTRTSYIDAACTVVDNLLNAVLTLQSTVAFIQKVFLSQLLPRHQYQLFVYKYFGLLFTYG